MANLIDKIGNFTQDILYIWQWYSKHYYFPSVQYDTSSCPDMQTESKRKSQLNPGRQVGKEEKEKESGYPHHTMTDAN